MPCRRRPSTGHTDTNRSAGRREGQEETRGLGSASGRASSRRRGGCGGGPCLDVLEKLFQERCVQDAGHDASVPQRIAKHAAAVQRDRRIVVAPAQAPTRHTCPTEPAAAAPPAPKPGGVRPTCTPHGTLPLCSAVPVPRAPAPPVLAAAAEEARSGFPAGTGGGSPSARTCAGARKASGGGRGEGAWSGRETAARSAGNGSRVFRPQQRHGVRAAAGRQARAAMAADVCRQLCGCARRVDAARPCCTSQELPHGMDARGWWRMVACTCMHAPALPPLRAAMPCWNVKRWVWDTAGMPGRCDGG